MVTEIVACLLVIAVLDSITSYQIRLLPFYAVPVFVLAWFCGKTWGIAAGLFSALLWWCANRFTGDPDLHSWIGVWEGAPARRLLSDRSVGWVGLGRKERYCGRVSRRCESFAALGPADPW